MELSADVPWAQGNVLPVAFKEVGTMELYAQKISHNTNGRFLAVHGGSDFVVYTATTLRNMTFGSGLEFVWSSVGSGDFAVREVGSKIRVFKNFKEHVSAVHTHTYV